MNVHKIRFLYFYMQIIVNNRHRYDKRIEVGCVGLRIAKTAKTKSRGNVVEGFALIAWMALATAQGQNLAVAANSIV